MPNSDLEQYLPDMEEFDMTREQKLEFLATLQLVVQTFVDRAWGIDSAQLAMRAAERDAMNGTTSRKKHKQ